MLETGCYVTSSPVGGKSATQALRAQGDLTSLLAYKTLCIHFASAVFLLYFQVSWWNSESLSGCETFPGTPVWVRTCSSMTVFSLSMIDWVLAASISRRLMLLEAGFWTMRLCSSLCVAFIGLIVFIGKCVVTLCDYYLEKKLWDWSSVKDRSVIGFFFLFQPDFILLVFILWTWKSEYEERRLMTVFLLYFQK